MKAFTASLDIIGINPFVSVPHAILAEILLHAGKAKGPVPVHGTVNGKRFTQTLMMYKGEWRLYINTSMLKNSPKRIGEIINLSIAYDPNDRTITPHPQLVAALNTNPEARKVFDHLPPSRQKEIVRYISVLKSPHSIDRNVQKAIDFLLGKCRFIGRDKP